MRALVTTKYGGPEVLKVEERPTPEPKANEVRIAVKRAGLNFADVAARVGLYPDAPKPPMVVGYEVAGVVDAVGPGVTTPIGTRVVGMTRFGGHASHVVVHQALARPIPDELSFDEAAALPVNYLTAFHMLHWIAPTRPGMTVLLHMAAGGVGLAALQLLKAIGGVTTIARASPSKHALLKESGATHCLDSSKPYADDVRRLTDGKGVHRVLDALGGKDWKTGYELLRPSGHLLAFGWANMVSGTKRNPLHVAREFISMPRFSPMQLMDANRSVTGVNLGHLWDEVELLGSHLDELVKLVKAGVVRPRVDLVVPLSRAAEAHQRIQSRGNVGKVVFNCEA